MSARYRSAPSPIHGRGVFARRRFRRGERVGVVLGDVVARYRRRGGALYAIGLEQGHLIPRGTPSGLWLVNHSCWPNAVLIARRRSADVVALRAIAPGAEITCDYRPSFHEGRLACRCGAANCGGRL